MPPVLRNGPDSGQDTDRLVFWPLSIAVGMPLIVGLIYGFAPVLTLLVVPLGILTLPFVALGALIVTFAHVRRRRWRKAASTVLLPIYISLIPLAPTIALGPFLWLGTWAHFWFAYPAYEAEIAALPADKPRFRVFDLGGFA